MLVIDDLQWADPASVKLWGRLARTARQVPLLLVGLTRPVPQREDLLALRRAVDEAARIQLDGAARAGRGRTRRGRSRAAGRTPGCSGSPPVRRATRSTSPNCSPRSPAPAASRSPPSGTAQLAAETVPDSLPAAIADRLGFVSAPTREVLRAAALLGVEFAVPDLTTVLGRSVADLVPALDEARATGVLTDAGGGTALAFRHPLIREALYAELPAAVRSAWHRDAGHALAAAGAAPDRVARQLLRAITGRTRRAGTSGRELHPADRGEI